MEWNVDSSSNETIYQMTVSSVFGKILSSDMVEEAVAETLKKWFPTYLAEIARQQEISLNLLPHPTNYSNRNSFDSESGERLPKVVVISPGLTGTPTKTGQYYNSSWRVGVGIAAAARTEQMANMLVKSYGAAARAILIQKQGLDGSIPIATIRWIDETYDDLPMSNQNQLLKAASIWFEVVTNSVLRLNGGPPEPDITAIEYPLVEEVIIDIERG